MSEVLSPPANQGNKEDGIWLEHKEVKRLRRIAVKFEFEVRVALWRGILIGVAIGFLLTAALHSGAN